MTNSRGKRRRPRPGTDLRVVSYIRRSSSADRVSGAMELESIRQWANNHGHLIVAEVADDAPGTELRSVGVDEALRMVKAHDADAVVVHKYSRFSRSRLDFDVNLGRLENVGARLISSTESMEPAIVHHWSLEMLAVLAGFEDARLADLNEGSAPH